MPPSSITITLPRRPAVWVAIGLAAGLLVAAIASPAFAPRSIVGADPTTPPEHTISVTGTGRVVVSPDIADLRLGVSSTKSTVKAARADAAQSMTKVIAALKKLGIADKDLKTTNLVAPAGLHVSEQRRQPEADRVHAHQHGRSDHPRPRHDRRCHRRLPGGRRHDHGRRDVPRRGSRRGRATGSHRGHGPGQGQGGDACLRSRRPDQRRIEHQRDELTDPLPGALRRRGARRRSRRRRLRSRPAPTRSSSTSRSST